MNRLRNFAKEKYRLEVCVKIAYVERMKLYRFYDYVQRSRNLYLIVYSFTKNRSIAKIWLSIIMIRTYTQQIEHDVFEAKR